MRGLFDPFRRETNEVPRARHGLGLGLFISKHIVQVHGGKVAVASARRTTTITMTLPRGEPLSATPPILTFQGPAPRRLNAALTDR